jgi:hypothetical protein
MNFKSHYYNRLKHFYFLKEGLIKTYPISIAVKKMNEKWENYLIEKFKASPESPMFFGQVISTPSFNLEKLKRDANLYGYFLSNTEKSGNKLTLAFSPKFSEKDNNNKDIVLYHLCPNKALPKILKIGITPRPSSKKDWPHPGDRAYILKVNLNNAYFDSVDSVSSVFSAIARASNSTLSDYSVIKIKNDPSLIDSLRIDPSFPGTKNSDFYGVYTNKNIPPSMFDKVMNIKQFKNDFIRETFKVNI